MTIEEYNSKKAELKKDYNKNLSDLAIQYAMVHNPFKTGDIVTDHIGSIKIEKIQAEIDFNSNIPACVYYGVELKKDLKPKAKEPKRYVYQTNVGKQNKM